MMMGAMQILAEGGATADAVAWWHPWMTLLMLVVMLAALVRNLVPPDVAFMGGLLVVVTVGIITPEEAFKGLSNPGLITVGALFIVAAGLRETGALHVAVTRVLGAETTLRAALARLMLPSAGMSAFVNNTPIVAMLMPEVLSWCRKRQFAPSRLLIPLSYATILGGVCTLIGTSTNIVVSGMMVDAERGLAPLAMFELATVGVPIALIGIAFIALIGYRLLPERKELIDQLGATQREYIVEMIVQSTCPYIGKTVQQAGLRNLPGLFLIEIDRAGRLLTPVKPTAVLEVDDRLVFTGMVRTILDIQRIPGLAPAEEMTYEIAPNMRRTRRLCEAVVSSSFPELGKTIRNSDFRTRYDAVVVAVHRNGARLRKKIGDIILRPGDTLLLQVGEHFERTFRGNTDFYLVSEVQDSAPVRHERAGVALGILGILVILLSTQDWTGLTTAVSALIGSALMVATRCVSLGNARRSVDWQVLVVIFAALGFGTAIDRSTLASGAAHLVVDAAQSIGGQVAVFIAVYVLTSLLTEIISNIGAAAIVFPIAIAVADTLGVDARPFCVVIAIAASASFATPIGYQTNLMVYGPGGYRFSDFLRVGVPMNLLVMVLAAMIIPIFWPLKPLVLTP
jgi:di/tricarboxylate transporter